MFAFMRSTFSLFGMTTIPRWTPQLITTCAGDAFSRSAMLRTSGSVKNIGFACPGSGRPVHHTKSVSSGNNQGDHGPSGEYAVIRIPFSWQNCCSSNDGRHGCTSTWFVTGTTVQLASTSVSVLIEKLDTPMDLTFPVHHTAAGRIPVKIMNGGEGMTGRAHRYRAAAPFASRYQQQWDIGHTEYAPLAFCKCPGD